MNKTVVLIKATDWFIREGERGIGEKFPAVDITAVGFVVDEADGYVAIATEMAEEEGMVRHVLTIPTSCIIHRQELASLL